jgi:tRNA 2-thiouridine synthesizing protein A
MDNNSNKSEEISDLLDISTDLCPMTFVKTRLFLEGRPNGQVVEIILAEGEPLDNLPAAVQLDGHNIVSLKQYVTGSIAESKTQQKLYSMVLCVGGNSTN